VYTYNLRRPECLARRVAGAVCSPTATHLIVSPHSPSILHDKKLWVPDYAAGASVTLMLLPHAPSSIEFTVERGGLHEIAANTSVANADDGKPARAAVIQPWWCVFRQALSDTGIGISAVPMLDTYSDLGLLGLVETAVSALGGAEGLSSLPNDSGETWRIAVRS
jgi:hypothetical protein